MQVYFAFGLRFFSPNFALPEFPVISSDGFDVLIQEGNVPNKMPITYGEVINIHDGKIEMSKNAFIYRTHKFAHFFIEEGKRITFQRVSVDASVEGIRLFLYGTCMNALMKQRRISLLHAACVLNETKSVVFFAQSGGGKSTVSNYFLLNGYQTIGDDILPVLEENGTCVLLPAYPQSKLWEESIEGLSISTETIRGRVRPDQNKYAIDTTAKFHHEQVTPTCAVFLEWQEDEKTIFERIVPIQAIFKYQRNAYKRGLYISPEDQQLLFKTASLLARTVPLYRFARKKATGNLQANLIQLDQYLNEI